MREDAEGVFGHLLLEPQRVLVPLHLDGALLADDQAFAAADAPGRIDDDVALGLDDGRLRAKGHADAAVAALFGIDPGVGDRMLVELAGPRGAAHAHVLDGRPEAGLDVPGDVGQADEGIGVAVSYTHLTLPT